MSQLHRVPHTSASQQNLKRRFELEIQFNLNFVQQNSIAIQISRLCL